MATPEEFRGRRETPEFHSTVFGPPSPSFQLGDSPVGLDWVIVAEGLGHPFPPARLLLGRIWPSAILPASVEVR